MSTATLVAPAVCTCIHAVDCTHPCHGRRRSPSETSGPLDYLPDEAGLTRRGCRACTPGQDMAHVDMCPTLVPVEYLWGSPELA